MKTKSWYIYHDIFYPWWDPIKEKLIWRYGDELSPYLLELPNYFATSDDVEDLIDTTALASGIKHDYIIRGR